MGLLCRGNKWIYRGNIVKTAIVALAIHSWCTSKVNYDIAKLEQRLGSILDLYIRSQR